MDAHLVPRWVRLGLVALVAVPQLLIGLWAMLAPAQWFDSFPGLGPALIAGEPPFNRHLVVDVGAGFFAVGIGVLLAAHWGTPKVVQLSLAVFVASTAPHVTYHVANPAPGLSSAADIANVAVLASGLGWAALLWWGSTRAPDQAPTTAERPDAIHAMS
jgi:hypothetical protein